MSIVQEEEISHFVRNDNDEIYNGRRKRFLASLGMTTLQIGLRREE